MIFRVDINEWQVSMDTIQVPIRVVVGQWSPTFLSEIFLLKSWALINVCRIFFIFCGSWAIWIDKIFSKYQKYETKK